MTESTRWTVRNVSLETIRKIADVCESTAESKGICFCYGALLDEAVDYWYRALPKQHKGYDD